MDSLRLIICVRPDCQRLFYLCQVCDRGQRYCSRACAADARRVTLQRAGFVGFDSVDQSTLAAFPGRAAGIVLAVVGDLFLMPALLGAREERRP